MNSVDLNVGIILWSCGTGLVGLIKRGVYLLMTGLVWSELGTDQEL